MSSIVDSIRDRVLWTFGFIPQEESIPREEQGFSQGGGQFIQRQKGRPLLQWIPQGQQTLSEIADETETDTKTVEEILTAVVSERAQAKAANEYYSEVIQDISNASNEDTETVQNVLRGFVNWMWAFQYAISNAYDVDQETAQDIAFSLIPYMAQVKPERSTETNLNENIAEPLNGSSLTEESGASAQKEERRFELNLRVAVNILSAFIIFGIAVGGVLGLFSVTEATISLVTLAVGILGSSVLTNPESTTRRPQAENETL